MQGFYCIVLYFIDTIVLYYIVLYCSTVSLTRINALKLTGMHEQQDKTPVCVVGVRLPHEH